jgi:four helix bundle protein
MSDKSIKSYRDLEVWKKSHNLTLEVLNIAETLSNGEVNKTILNQLIRSVMSISANIAEGYGRHKGREFRNYLYIARGSATEADYWFLLCFDKRLLSKEQYEKLSSECREIILMLSSLIKKL